MYRGEVALARPQPLGAARNAGREYDRYLCAPDEGIAAVAGGAANGRLQQELRGYRAAHLLTSSLMNRRMHEYGARCNREIGGNTPHGC